MMRKIALLVTVFLAACSLIASIDTPITIGRNERIVIVGGGPAGIHYATLLAKKGFNKITILEAADVVGGKSVTYTDNKGIPHELGTCYAHGLYTPIFELLQEYDPSNVKIPFVPTIKGHTTIYTDNSTTTLDYNGYIVKLAMSAGGLASPANVSAALSKGFQVYIGLHHSIFGTYAYGLPPQPKDWSLVNIPALEFLKKNKLMVLEAFFRYVFEQQGYGSLDNTPAFYMLWWIHPDVILKRLQLPTPESPWVFMLSKGYQSLWKAMANAFPKQITVKLNSRVTRITRNARQPYVTVQRASGAFNRVPFDHLVMAVDLSQNVPWPNDLSAAEASLIKDQFTASTFVVSLVESDPLQNETVSLWWPYRGIGDTQGQLQLTRNSRLALYNPLPANGSPQDPLPTDWGVNATGRQSHVTYQYYNTSMCDASTSRATVRQLLKDLAKIDATRVIFRKQVVYNYAPRFKQASLEAGALWNVWNAQGEYKTTWIGSSVSYESVLDVVTYNNLLIQRVQVQESK